MTCPIRRAQARPWNAYGRCTKGNEPGGYHLREGPGLLFMVHADAAVRTRCRERERAGLRLTDVAYGYEEGLGVPSRGTRRSIQEKPDK